MTKYLRSKVNGIIFDYDERMARNSEVEVISEAEAYPERSAPVDLKAREQKVDLAVPVEIVEAPVLAPPELSAQKGRLFGNADTQVFAKKVKKAEPAPSGFDVAGLKGEF